MQAIMQIWSDFFQRRRRSYRKRRIFIQLKYEININYFKRLFGVIFHFDAIQDRL